MKIETEIMLIYKRIKQGAKELCPSDRAGKYKWTCAYIMHEWSIANHNQAPSPQSAMKVLSDCYYYSETKQLDKAAFIEATKNLVIGPPLAKDKIMKLVVSLYYGEGA